jgi:hypothetical protein
VSDCVTQIYVLVQKALILMIIIIIIYWVIDQTCMCLRPWKPRNLKSHILPNICKPLHCTFSFFLPVYFLNDRNC